MYPLSSRVTHDFSNRGGRTGQRKAVRCLPENYPPKNRPISLVARKNAISVAKSVQKHPPTPHGSNLCMGT